jgi:bacteriorhodopsin
MPDSTALHSTALWTTTLSQPEHTLVLYFLVVAALALFAGTIRSLLTRNEVGSRYRPAVVARIAVVSVATVSYGILIVEFIRGYTPTGSGTSTSFVPNTEAIMSFAPRYMDWSVTVPMLTLELLAVCTLAGATARRTQAATIAGAFLMILSGFIGMFVTTGDTASLLIWGGISTVFWIFTNVVLIRAVRQSFAFITPQAGGLLRNATIVLLSGWVIYPVIFVVQIFAGGGAWTTAIQVALCLADVVIKIGFGGLVHRVAKLRTAEDVRAGDDVHPESIWISSIKLSDAGRPREVYLAEGASVHPSRNRPPAGAAIPAEPPVDFDE